jgi:hypothetical protein
MQIMWFPSIVGSLDFCSFHSRTRRGRRPPTRKLGLETLEDRTLLSAVHPLFDLAALTTSPFPSDRWTVADTSQNTGRRVNLPLPDLITHPSDREDTQVLNTLDGFNMQPRLSIPFDGPIDVSTVNSQDVFLVRMGDTLDPHDHGGQVVGINQVVWDPATNTLHVESNDLLDQHTRYALVVTNGVHDAGGQPVEATLGFRLAPLTLALSHDPVLRSYGVEMVEGLLAAHGAGVREQDIVTASVFRTESATAVLEKIRDQIHAATPGAADFNLGPDGSRTVFNLDEVKSVTWNQQTGVNPTVFNPVDVDLSLLRNTYPGTVGQVAFGKYVSPDYEVHPGEYIPPVGTRTGTPQVQSYHDVYFNLVLPSGPKPAAGWPVAIFGHGNNNNQYFSFLVAASMAAHGVATLSINAVGHGFGPLGTLTVNGTVGDPVTFLAGGRGIDQNGDHVIGGNEGVAAAPPRAIISSRDGARQTAVDLLQLVREIGVGMDVNGDGIADLDASHVNFFSISFGGSYGVPFVAVEPSVGVGAFNVVASGWVGKTGRLSTGPQRSNIGSSLASRVPALINPPGIAELDGVPIAGPRFNENMPLRDGVPLSVRLEDGTSYTIQSPVINTVTGAMEIDELLESTQWVSQASNPAAYAPHLRKDPLEGVPAKSVIVQFAKGDQTGNNPTTSAILRAGNLADRATYYRNDLAYAEDHNVAKNPHAFMLDIGNPDKLVRSIALGAQDQIATFFASDGAQVIQPPGVPEEFFEVPIHLPLPEDLNFIPASAPAAAPAHVSGSRSSGPVPAETAGGSPPISGLFAALQLEGTPAGPGAVIAASWSSQLANPLLDEGSTIGAGATFLAEHSLPENSIDPDPWRLTEPTQADQIHHRLPKAPATSKVLYQDFAGVDDGTLQDMFGDYRIADRVG